VKPFMTCKIADFSCCDFYEKLNLSQGFLKKVLSTVAVLGGGWVGHIPSNFWLAPTFPPVLCLMSRSSSFD